MYPLLKAFHIAAVVVWVGGMFFAWMVLRPVAASQLDAATRLRLWASVFARFFPWVWASVTAVLASGLWTFLPLGFAHTPHHWHLMLLLGLCMSALFVYVFLRPYASLKAAVAAENWPAGGKALGRIRQLVGVNLILGISTILVATAGSLLG